MNDPVQADKKPFLVAAIVALGVVLAAYANHFDNGFHFDDSHAIQDNVFIRSLGNIPRFFTDASTYSTLPNLQTYRPLLTATWAMAYSIAGGLNTTPFHVTQVSAALTDRCGAVSPLPAGRRLGRSGTGEPLHSAVRGAVVLRAHSQY